jgi:hypothetical protein
VNQREKCKATRVQMIEGINRGVWFTTWLSPMFYFSSQRICCASCHLLFLFLPKLIPIPAIRFHFFPFVNPSFQSNESRSSRPRHG